MVVVCCCCCSSSSSSSSPILLGFLLFLLFWFALLFLPSGQDVEEHENEEVKTGKACCIWSFTANPCAIYCDSARHVGRCRDQR